MPHTTARITTGLPQLTKLKKSAIAAALCIFITCLAGRADNTIYLQNTATGRIRGPFTNHEKNNESLDGTFFVTPADQLSQRDLCTMRLLQTVVPSVSFRDTKLITVLRQLAETGQAKDKSCRLNFAVYSRDAAVLDRKITFSAKNRTLGQLIDITSSVADTEYKIVKNEVLFLAGTCSERVTYSNETTTIYRSRWPRIRESTPAKNGGADLAGWKLRWSDEFSGDKLDETKWSRCKRGRSDWNNTMSDDPQLLAVKNGVLHLRGIQNPNLQKDAAPYLTAGIYSNGKFSFRYGKVVIRAKCKSAAGAWPALWMLGEKGKWPGNGEIDLMEHLNYDDIVYHTVHSFYTEKIDKENNPKHGTTAAIEKDEWNTYGCEWDEDKIVLTVNGQPTLTYPRIPDKGADQWPFKQPFYFVLSMQIGGKWVNGFMPTDAADYPAEMAIDWVRVYTRKN